GRVRIAVQHEAADGADRRAHGPALGSPRAAPAALLHGRRRGDRCHALAGARCRVGEERPEERPERAPPRVVTTSWCAPPCAPPLRPAWRPALRLAPLGGEAPCSSGLAVGRRLQVAGGRAATESIAYGRSRASAVWCGTARHAAGARAAAAGEPLHRRAAALAP